MERWIEVDIGKIRKNIIKMKNFTGRKFMATVKSDFYGMGAEFLSKKIEDVVDYFGVATPSEAIQLKEKKVKKPILVLGPVLPSDVDELVMRDVEITLSGEEIFRKIRQITKKREKKATVHIKVDTGMGRIGVKVEEAVDFFKKVVEEKGIFVKGIFTHLATAEWRNKEYAKYQIETFYKVLEEINEIKKVPLKHIANSASILNIPETYKNFDMVRIGLLTLGVYPEKYLSKKLKLDCALSGFCYLSYFSEYFLSRKSNFNVSHNKFIYIRR